jgi:hypothetical protein
MIQASELARRIIAAQQRHRQLFERSERQAKHKPRSEDETIPSEPSLIVRAADRLRLSDIPIWHAARGSPSFVPQPHESLSIGAPPPFIGSEDAGTNAVGTRQRAAKAPRQGSAAEVDGYGIVDDTAKPSRGDLPAVGAAIVIEPGAHAIEALAEAC